DARGRVEDQGKRPLRICQTRVAAEPDKLLASNQSAAILAGAPLSQNEVELSGVERLQQTAAEPHRQFEIDGAMNARELAENLRQAALDEILRGAKADAAAQLRAGEIAPRAFV